MSFKKGVNTIGDKVLVDNAAIKTDDWVRNPSWLPLPSLQSTDQRVVGLHKIYPTGYNFLSLSCAGAYQVDWGDGSIENYTANTQAYHNYYYVPTIDAGSSLVTFSTNTVTKDNHGLSNGMLVKFYNVTGNYYLNPSLSYFVINSNSNTFQVSATFNGSPITISKETIDTATVRALLNSNTVVFGLTTITKTSHGLTNGTVIRFSNIDVTTWLDEGIDYYVISATENTFQIATSLNGSLVTILKDGSSQISLTANLTTLGVELSTDTITKNNHGLSNGSVVRFVDSSAYYNVSTIIDYYVISADTNTFKVSTTVGGSAVALIKDGTSNATFKATLSGALVLSNYNTIIKIAHGLVNGNIVQFDTSDAYLNVTTNTNYYIINANTDNFQVSDTLGGAAINIAKDGTGIATLTNSVTSIVASWYRDTVSLNGHGLTNGTVVKFPTAVGFQYDGVTVNTTYYVVQATTNTFKISESSNGNAVVITSSSAGTVTNKTINVPNGYGTTTTSAVTLQFDTVTKTNHGYANGTVVTFTSIVGTTLINTVATYEIKNATTNTFNIAALGTTTVLPIMPTGVTAKLVTTGAVTLGLDTITKTNHGYVNGNKVTFSGTVGTTSLGDTEYAIANATTDTFKLNYTNGSVVTSIMPTGGSLILGYLPVMTGAIEVVLGQTTVTKANHGYPNGTKVKFSNIVGYAVIAPNVDYFIVGATTNSFSISTFANGSAIPIMPSSGTANVGTLSTVTTDIEVALAFDTIIKANHGLNNGTIVSFASISGLSLLSVNTDYYVTSITTNTFRLSATAGGVSLPIMSTVGGSNITVVDVTTNTDRSVTIVDSVVTRNNHGYSNGMKVSFYNIVGSVELITDLNYYVVNATADTFQVALVAQNSAITCTNGSATLLPYKQVVVSITPQAGQSLTTVNLHKRYDSNLPNQYLQQLSYANASYVSGFVDIAIAGNYITNLFLGATTDWTTNNNAVYFHDLERFNLLSSRVSNISYLFYNCKGLQKIENFVCNPDTGVVTSTNVFRGCATLKTVPLFNTLKFSSFTNFFYDCYNLENVPKFNTMAATSLSGMFQNCYSITSIPDFYTNEGTTNIDTSSMFKGCISLEKAPYLSLRYSTNLSNMFSGCKALTTIPLYNLNTTITAPLDASNMFNECDRLQSIPLLNTSKVTNFSGMFSHCGSLKSVPALDTSAGTNLSGMFSNCVGLETIPLLNTANATNLFELFKGCSNLKVIPLINTGSNVNFSYMFAECSSLRDIPKLDTANGVNFRYMFAACSSLDTIPNIDTTKATDFSYMFLDCASLTVVPVLQSQIVTNFSGMFKGCTRIRKLPALYMGAVTDPANLMEIIGYSPNIKVYGFYGITFDFSLIGLSLSIKDVETIFWNMGTGHGRNSQIVYLDYSLREQSGFRDNRLWTYWDTGDAGVTKLNHIDIHAEFPRYNNTPLGPYPTVSVIEYAEDEGPIIYGKVCGLTSPASITIMKPSILFTAVNHGLVNGQEIQFSNVSPAIGGYSLLNNCNINIKSLENEYDPDPDRVGRKYITRYYVMNATTNTYQVGGTVDKGDTTVNYTVGTSQGYVDIRDVPRDQISGEIYDPLTFKGTGTVTVFGKGTATMSKRLSYFSGSKSFSVTSRDTNTNKAYYIVYTNSGGHRFNKNGEMLSFSYLGTMPDDNNPETSYIPCTDSVHRFTIYYVTNTPDGFYISLTKGGTPIDILLNDGVVNRGCSYNYITRLKRVQGVNEYSRNPITGAMNIFQNYPYVETTYNVGIRDGYGWNRDRYYFINLNIAIALLKGWAVFVGNVGVFYPYYVPGALPEMVYVGS